MTERPEQSVEFFRLAQRRAITRDIDHDFYKPRCFAPAREIICERNKLHAGVSLPHEQINRIKNNVGCRHYRAYAGGSGIIGNDEISRGFIANQGGYLNQSGALGFICFVWLGCIFGNTGIHKVHKFPRVDLDTEVLGGRGWNGRFPR